MSRALDIITGYYESYPEPGPDDTPDRYELERRMLRQFLHVADRVMAQHGVDEDTRAAVVLRILYGSAGDPAERERLAEAAELPAVQPVGEG